MIVVTISNNVINIGCKWADMSDIQLNKIFLLWIIFSIFICPAKASTLVGPQQPILIFEQKGNQDNGLATPYVLKVLQDKDGFIWAATQNGLFRFDGYHYKLFRHNADDPSSLAGNYIQNLYEDNRGRLWVSIWRGGVAQYHPETESFTSYRHNPNANSLSNDEVMAITSGDNDTLWIATLGGGINHFSPTTKQFTHFRHDANDINSLSDDNVYTLLQDSKGTLWAGTRNGGLNRFDASKSTFTHFKHNSSTKGSLSHNKVYTLLEDAQGRLWVGTRGGGLNLFNPDSETFTSFQHEPANPYSISSNFVWDIFQDRTGGLWIATHYGGLSRLDVDTGYFANYRHAANDSNSISATRVSSIIQDNQGLLWLGTYGGGLNTVDPESEYFGRVEHIPDNPNSLLPGSVHAIYKSEDNSLWIGSTSGLSHLDEISGVYTHYQHDPFLSNSLRENDVRAIAKDANGEIWLGTNNKGLSKLTMHEGSTATFEHYQYNPEDDSSISDNSITAIHKDNDGNLWVGTQNGLNLWQPETKKFIRFYHSSSDTTTLSHNGINALYTSKDGTLWLGTNGGLNKLNNDRKTFSRYENDPNNLKSLSRGMVTSIAEDSQNRIWVGTESGLNKLNDDGVTFQHYKKQLLSSATTEDINAIIIDKSDNIWIGGRGLSFLAADSSQIRNHIATTDRCSANEGAYFQGNDGKMFFGDSVGFCGFYPFPVKPEYTPPIVFTDFRLQNKSVPISTKGKITPLSKVMNKTKQLTLTHEDNVFSFEFAALNFHNKRDQIYQYKMEGFSNHWIETQWDNSRATFTNLPGGNYTFKVRASNSNGGWESTGRTIELTVLPPPWKTWWAYTSYVLVILILLLKFVSRQQQKINREQEFSKKLAQTVKERTIELEENNNALQAALKEVEKVSWTDQLTGAYNRLFFSNVIIPELAKLARKYKGQKSKDSYGFLIVDIDNFKQVNDQYGHNSGDKVLIEVAKIFSDTCRGSDWIIRWGGEEFLIVVEMSSLNDLQQLAERIRVNTQSHQFILDNSETINITCSIGISCYPFFQEKFDAVSWEQTIVLSDKALYVAKNSQKNAWISFSAGKMNEVPLDTGQFHNQVFGFIKSNIVEMQHSSNISSINLEHVDL